MYHRYPRGVGLIGVALIASLVPAASAGAQEPTFTCRASAGYTDRPGEDRLEPVVANGNTNTTEANADRPRCADDSARTADRSIGGLTQRNPSAVTELDPDTGPTSGPRASSSTRVDSTTLVSGTFVLTADEVVASATASCTGQTPTYSGTSQVSNLRINGEAVATDQTFTEVGTGLNGGPLGGLIEVRFNEETAGGGTTSQSGLTRRAIHVVIKDGGGGVVYEAVAGEARVGSSGEVCAATAPGGPTPGGGLCPSGASFDELSGFCLRSIVVGRNPDGSCPLGATPAAGGTCVREVPVNARGENMVGGSLVPLDKVPGMRASACRNPRFGVRVGIVGTNRKDKVTGTNKSDRIFVYGGNDIVSAGRGFDCVETGSGRNRADGGLGGDFLFGGGGPDFLSGGLSNDRVAGNGGNDRLDGGLGNDRVSGGAGKDKVTGGRGNDLLLGGPGNDYIVPDRGGSDRVVAGAGNDVINAAVAGKPARVNCGPGRDTVRVNKNGLKKLRGCERKLVSRRVR